VWDAFDAVLVALIRTKRVIVEKTVCLHKGLNGGKQAATLA